MIETRDGHTVKAVCSDLNGTLDDMEGWRVTAWFDALERMRLRLSPEVLQQTVGVTGQVAQEVITAEVRQTHDVNLLEDQFQIVKMFRDEHLNKRISEDGWPVHESAPELCRLITVKHGLPLVLVTSSSRVEIAPMYTSPLGEFFGDGRVISGDDVTNKKPDKEPHVRGRHRCEEISGEPIKPFEALGLEDSHVGAISVDDAGGLLVGVGKEAVRIGSPVQQLCKAGFGDLSLVLNYLA